MDQQQVIMVINHTESTLRVSNDDANDPNQNGMIQKFK